jgi:hypothetical protein
MAEAIHSPEEVCPALGYGPFPQTERRATKRYPCGPTPSVLLHLRESSAIVEAGACNLSEGGIGLNVPFPLEVGIIVMLQLRGQQVVGPVLLLARVIHAAPQSEGTWRVGCAFERRLDPETLEALLAPQL